MRAAIEEDGEVVEEVHHGVRQQPLARPRGAARDPLLEPCGEALEQRLLGKLLFARYEVLERDHRLWRGGEG